jgi:hypothetical protein
MSAAAPSCCAAAAGPASARFTREEPGRCSSSAAGRTRGRGRDTRLSRTTSGRRRPTRQGEPARHCHTCTVARFPSTPPHRATPPTLPARPQLQAPRPASRRSLSSSSPPAQCAPEPLSEPARRTPATPPPGCPCPSCAWLASMGGPPAAAAVPRRPSSACESSARLCPCGSGASVPGPRLSAWRTKHATRPRLELARAAIQAHAQPTPAPSPAPIHHGQARRTARHRSCTPARPRGPHLVRGAHHVAQLRKAAQRHAVEVQAAAVHPSRATRLAVARPNAGRNQRPARRRRVQRQGRQVRRVRRPARGRRRRATRGAELHRAQVSVRRVGPPVCSSAARPADWVGPGAVRCHARGRGEHAARVHKGEAAAAGRRSARVAALRAPRHRARAARPRARAAAGQQRLQATLLHCRPVRRRRVAVLAANAGQRRRPGQPHKRRPTWHVQVAAAVVAVLAAAAAAGPAPAAAPKTCAASAARQRQLAARRAADRGGCHAVASRRQHQR